MNCTLKRAVPLATLALTAACTGAPNDVGMPLSPAGADEAVTVNAVAANTAVAAPATGVEETSRSTRTVPAPKLFDKAFRDASAQRHADDIARLTQAFLDLGPGVDPEEAARAARVVYTYVDQLVVEYEIEDPPLVHNTKVNFGQKPRGLCWHWAHDVDIRLQMERFKTLEIHRAIANYNNLRLEHSTTLLGPRGGKMEDAIVLDPWRNGGVLFWEIARKDTRYNWTPRDEVFAYKRARKTGQARADKRRAATGTRN